MPELASTDSDSNKSENEDENESEEMTDDVQSNEGESGDNDTSGLSSVRGILSQLGVNSP